MVHLYLKISSRLRGEPTEPKIWRVGRGKGNSEAVELGSGQGKPSCTYGSVKYEEGFEKGYRLVITNIFQARKKPSIKNYLFEMVDRSS